MDLRVVTRLGSSAVALFFVACSTCETATGCTDCGPADACNSTAEVCVDVSCETNEDCEDGAYCGEGRCQPIFCG